MTNKQLHRLKKQWLAEGYRMGKRRAQLNESLVSRLAKVAWNGLKTGGARFIKGAAKKGGKYLAKGAKSAGKLVWKAAKEALTQATIDLLQDTLPKILKKEGAAAVKKISTASKNKAEVSKNMFTRLMYSALAEIPYEEIVNLTVDSISDNVIKGINDKLSTANGYVAPSTEDIEKAIQYYKAKNN